jgi:C4-type Zn-finger protein
VDSNTKLNPAQCPKCGSNDVKLEEDYGRRPTVVQYDVTIAFAGDWHLQDWICRSCGYDWRVAEVFGESEFLIDKGELKRKDGTRVDM